jgi:hypothetical protein
MWLNLLVALVMLQPPIPTLPGLPSPTPVATVTPAGTLALAVPHSDIYNFLATAAANVNALPNDISAPGGVPLFANPDASPLFGYAKWMFSGSGTQELLGQTLSPFGTRVFLVVTAALTLTSIYFIVRFATLILKGVIWLLYKIRAIFP